jgi:stringent starvation protein B
MPDISTKPYLLRAIYEWCTDSGYTPYLAVKVDAATTVPMEYVKKGEIILNISYGATSGLKMDNDAITFRARFNGVSRELYIPVQNVLAIYANENGQGMAFDVSTTAAELAPAPAPVPRSRACFRIARTVCRSRQDFQCAALRGVASARRRQRAPEKRWPPDVDQDQIRV